MGNRGLISLIIPIYKTEQCLEECLNSILFQTYSFFEAILVLDGINERCHQICCEYAAKDARFSVYKIPHQGVSAARNYGMQFMKGDYVAFIDSDDSLHPLYLETLLNDLIQYNSDIACCGFMKDGSNAVSDDSGEVIVTNGKEAVKLCRLYRKKRFSYGTALWNKMFRTSALGNSDIFDVSFMYGEDTVFLFPVLLKTERVSFNPAVRYIYHGNRTNEKREYYIDANLIKYYEWERDFFNTACLNEELVQEAERTLIEVRVTFWIDAYLEGKKNVREEILTHWEFILKYIINGKSLPFWGRMKVMITVYMIRFGFWRRLVAFVFHLHD